MTPAPFAYHAPTTIDEAAGLLAGIGDGAKAIAGGQSLAPMPALWLTVFDHLVDLGRIDALRGIERRGDSIWVGGGTRPTRAAGIEKRPIGTRPDDVDAAELGGLAVDGLDEISSDLHGSRDFRRRVGAEMTARAWIRSVTEARHV